MKLLFWRKPKWFSGHTFTVPKGEWNVSYTVEIKGKETSNTIIVTPIVKEEKS